MIRGIAQSGSAPALGAGCRGFESLYPDHFMVYGERSSVGRGGVSLEKAKLFPAERQNKDVLAGVTCVEIMLRHGWQV